MHNGSEKAKIFFLIVIILLFSVDHALPQAIPHDHISSNIEFEVLHDFIGRIDGRITEDLRRFFFHDFNSSLVGTNVLAVRSNGGVSFRFENMVKKTVG